jgi:broad specificity phosphatase PhoE
VCRGNPVSVFNNEFRNFAGKSRSKKNVSSMQKRSRLDNVLRASKTWLHLFWIVLVIAGRSLRWREQFRLQNKNDKGSAHHRMKQTLLFIRHGQTTWNVDHRLPGQLPGVALNETGHKQAARLAESLTVLPISAIVSSPLERARDTAAYLAKGRDLEILLEPELMDTNVGPWAGQKIEELSRNDPAWKAYVKDPKVAPEGIETFPQVQQRVVAAVERWRAQDHLGAYVAFVAHADVIKLLVAHYTGLEVGRAGSIFIDNASVSLVEVEKDQSPHVVSIGWSPAPGWLKTPLPEKPQQIDEAQETGEQKT